MTRIRIEQLVPPGTLRRPIPATAFKDSPVYRIEGPPQFALYKVTHAAAVDPRRGIAVGRDGFITPWWFSYESATAAGAGATVPIRGIADKLEAASRTRARLVDYLRSRGAVCHDWNVMTHVLIIALERPVVGLLGPCSGQPLYEDANLRTAKQVANVTFIGGEQQFYLPGLRPGDVSVRMFGPIP